MFADYFQEKVNNALEAAKDGLEQQIEAKLEEICTKALGKLFHIVVRDIRAGKQRYKNDWLRGSYSHAELSEDYFYRKLNWGANDNAYFKARHYFSRSNPKLKKYPYQQSVFSIFERARRDASLGKELYKMSGGVGLSVKGSGVDYTKGRVVNGQAKKFGKRKRLVNARWQDIVNKEWLSKANIKGSRFKLAKGYYRTDTGNKILTPQGTVISKARAIATGVLTFSSKGEFFSRIAKNERGFLDFILRTRVLEEYAKDRDINAVLGGLASDNRHILDPVFGEILKIIDDEFDAYLETL